MADCPYAIFAQNLALRQLLHYQFPPRPQNPRPALVPRADGVLKLARETELAETFAFLSGISHKSEQVGAVCILEAVDRSSLSIVVAVNMGALDPRHETLARIKTGFEGILRSLREVRSSE